jgi:hypothetical protein
MWLVLRHAPIEKLESGDFGDRDVVVLRPSPDREGVQLGERRRSRMSTPCSCIHWSARSGSCTALVHLEVQVRPVEWPVEPSLPICSPAVTRWPASP